MNLKFVLIISQTIFIFLSVLLLRSMLGFRGLSDVLTAFLILLFFAVVFLFANRRFWLAMAISSWLLSLSIPVPPLDTFTVGFVALALISGLYLLEQVVQRKSLVYLKPWGNRLLFVAMALMFVRFVIDRPGSARMGGMGGLRQALGYTSALPFFFITEKLARDPSLQNGRKLLQFFLWVSIVMMGIRVLMRFMGRGVALPIYMGWYEGPMWLLMPLVLAWFLNPADSKRASLVRAFLCSGFMLLLGILSPFRSRIFFALGSVAAVFWCSGYRRRFVLGSILLFCIVAPLLAFMPKERIPVVARRALSTIIPYERADVEAIRDRGIDVSPEYGWGSGFRASLLEHAIRNVRRNPLLGQGWGISMDDLMLGSSFDPHERLMHALVASGEYHNSLIAVAVKSGLPAALLITIGLVLLLVPCVQNVDQVPKGELKILYIGVVGGLVAIMGQMLMNGGFRELQGVCIYLGFLRGVIASDALVLHSAGNKDVLS